MSNVISFPAKEVRDWAHIEQELTDFLHRVGASKECGDRVMKRIRVAFDELQAPAQFTINLPLTFPSTLSVEICEQLSSQIGQQVSAQVSAHLRNLDRRYFIARVKLEIEACSEFGLG